jgi:hypothetical protein
MGFNSAFKELMLLGCKEFDCKQTNMFKKKKKEERILGSTLLLEACHRFPIESMPGRMLKALAVLRFVTPHQRRHSW